VICDKDKFTFTTVSEGKINIVSKFDGVLKINTELLYEINNIEGLYAFGPELTAIPGCFNFDETKLGINVRRLGYTGYQAEAILRQRYNIQIELADLYNILAIVSLGDREEDLAALVNALKDLAIRSISCDFASSTINLECPEMIISPRDAFYSPGKQIRLENSIGEIAGEMVLAYPPGIPVICPGERITRQVVDYIKLLKEEKCELQGTADPRAEYIRILNKTRKG
jgi:arginine decarboxylase